MIIFFGFRFHLWLSFDFLTFLLKLALWAVVLLISIIVNYILRLLFAVHLQIFLANRTSKRAMIPFS